MGKTYRDRQLGSGEKIKDSYDKINQNSKETGRDFSDLYGQIQSLIMGSSNATIGVYAISPTGIDAYSGEYSGLDYFTGLFINMQNVLPNTDASTFNLNGLGDRPIKIRNDDGTLRDLLDGEMHDEAQLLYDGSYFILVRSSGGGLQLVVAETLPEIRRENTLYFKITSTISQGTNENIAVSPMMGLKLV